MTMALSWARRSGEDDIDEANDNAEARLCHGSQGGGVESTVGGHDAGGLGESEGCNADKGGDGDGGGWRGGGGGGGDVGGDNGEGGEGALGVDGGAVSTAAPGATPDLSPPPQMISIAEALSAPALPITLSVPPSVAITNGRGPRGQTVVRRKLEQLIHGRLGDEALPDGEFGLLRSRRQERYATAASPPWP